MTAEVVELSSDTTLQSIHKVALELREILLAGRSLRLDVAAVRQPDLSLVQLIEVARRHSVDTGSTFALTAPVTVVWAALLERAGFLTAPTAADTQFWFQGEPQ